MGWLYAPGWQSITMMLGATVMRRGTGRYWWYAKVVMRACGWLSPRTLADSASEMAARMKVDPPDTSVEIQTLSGGNQQKVIVGRWLAAGPKVIIFDEPTQGIDVGTKAQIYRLIADLAAEGKAVILISSEFIELAELADRVIVVRGGRIEGELSGGDLDEDRLFRECIGEDAA